MKKLVMLAGLAALTACGDGTVEEPTVVEQPVMQSDGMIAADGQPFVGTFELSGEDGTSSFEVADDGTFVRTGEDGTASTGRFEDRNGERCAIYDAMDGTEGETMCATEGPAAQDGSWTVTGADGTVRTARRIVVAADEDQVEDAQDPQV